MSELDDLKREVAALKDQLNPKPFKSEWRGPIDYTAGMSMDRGAMKAMMDAVPDALMKELRGDARRLPVTYPSSMIPTSNERTETKRGSGWISERPLEPPPGIKILDQIMDQQDKIDRAEMAVKLMKAGMMEKKG